MQAHPIHSIHAASRGAAARAARRQAARPLVLAMIAAATLGLAACGDRNEPADRGDARTTDNPTIGQRVDQGVARVEQGAERARQEAAQGTAEARREAGQAVDAAKQATGDAAITAAVNAQLARDNELSALRIDVDTSEGRVALKGTAPTPAARDRATQLARAVDGVKSVDNQLVVKPKG